MERNCRQCGRHLTPRGLCPECGTGLSPEELEGVFGELFGTGDSRPTPEEELAN